MESTPGLSGFDEKLWLAISALSGQLD